MRKCSDSTTFKSGIAASISVENSAINQKYNWHSFKKCAIVYGKNNTFVCKKARRRVNEHTTYYFPNCRGKTACTRRHCSKNAGKNGSGAP